MLPPHHLSSVSVLAFTEVPASPAPRVADVKLVNFLPLSGAPGRTPRAPPYGWAAATSGDSWWWTSFHSPPCFTQTSVTRQVPLAVFPAAVTEPRR
jgi:hypothetical protein